MLLPSSNMLRIIRRALTNDTAHSLVRSSSSTIGSITATGYWLHHRIYLIAKLQSVLRVAARLILRLPSRSSVSASMRLQLHWLNIDERLSGSRWLCWPTNPSTDWLQHIYPDTAFLYSSSSGSLSSPVGGRVAIACAEDKTVTLGPRGFFWACPSTWNTLPAPLRDFELSLDSFKRKLKSHFFTS